MIWQDLQGWKTVRRRDGEAQSAYAWGLPTVKGITGNEAKKSEEGGAHEGSQPRSKDQGQQVKNGELSCLRGKGQPGLVSQAGGKDLEEGWGQALAPCLDQIQDTCFPGQTV